MYIVCWINAAGKKRAKTFSLGRSDVVSTAFDNHGLDVAKRCRAAWEKHTDNNTLHLFDPDLFQLDKSLC